MMQRSEVASLSARLHPRKRDVHPVQRLPLHVQRQPDGDDDGVGPSHRLERLVEACAVCAEDILAAGGKFN